MAGRPADYSDVHILLVEGKRSDRDSFLTGLSKKNFQVETTSSGSAALKRLEKLLPDIIIVDAASLRSSGVRICAALHDFAPRIPLVLVLEEGVTINNSNNIDVVLNLPFTLQKLLNRLKPFLRQQAKHVKIVGPIHLDTMSRSVHCGEHQALLTPRLAALLGLLMDNTGDVIERAALFSKVWETDYTGDTRTLDVHISWLRQAIEDDPRHPRYVKTVRGVGYRLDVQ